MIKDIILLLSNGGMTMRASGIAILFGATLTALDPAVAGPAGPSTGGLALTRAAETYPVIEVRNRAGAAVAGAVAGGIIGGIIASQGGFGYPPTYPYPYYQPYPAYPGNPAIGYCMSRFRSYDPYTMTYLGYDGYRHPCP